MNRKILRSGLAFLILGMISSGAVYGQFNKPKRIVNCSQYLNEAEDLFDAGRISKIPEILNRNKGVCFHGDGFTKEEKIQAYRLMALVHIFKDEEVEAEEAVIHLLKVDPEHSKNPNDPQELIYLLEKYKTDPIFRLGIKIGANQTIVSELEEFGTYDVSGQSKTYSPKLGMNIEATFEYSIVKNLDVLMGVQWSNQSYEVQSEVLNPTVLTGSDFLLTLKETQTSLKIPLMIRYRLFDNKFSPYVLAGASMDYLLSSTMAGERSGIATVPLTGLKLKDFDLRQKYNFSYFAGAGIKLRVNKVNFLVFEARYNLGGANIVKVDNRYNSDKLGFDLNHVDSDKKLNYLGFSVGYVHSFYNPKKYSDKKLAKISQNKAKKLDQ